MGLALFPFVGGLLSLSGWAFDLPRLADWGGVGVGIQPNAGLLLACAGGALVLLHMGWTRAAVFVAAIEWTIAALTIIERLAQVDLGFDRMLLFERTWGRQAVTSPGRMGLPGSLAHAFIATALGRQGPSRSRRRRAATSRRAGVLGRRSAASPNGTPGTPLAHPRREGIAPWSADPTLATGPDGGCAPPRCQPKQLVNTLAQRPTSSTYLRRNTPCDRRATRPRGRQPYFAMHLLLLASRRKPDIAPGSASTRQAGSGRARFKSVFRSLGALV